MDGGVRMQRCSGGETYTPQSSRGEAVTLRRLEMEGADELARAGVEEARLDAHRLLLEAFGLDETHYLLERMRPMADDTETEADDAAAKGAAAGTAGVRECAEKCGAAARGAAAGEMNSRRTDAGRSGRTSLYREMISHRAARIPLQQILGQQEFMGLLFQVNEHVLIPRQDTETLAELVLAEQKDASKKVLDLCTGSGCIAISLAVKGSYTDVTAADLSAEALAVAEQNAGTLLPAGWRICVFPSNIPGGASPYGVSDGISGVGCSDSEDSRVFRLCRGDLFSALPQDSRYDVIVSNPPYIPSSVIEGLQPEVRDHEPRMALDGEEDGLAFYRRIAAQAPDWLNPGGAVYLEIGCDQAEAVRELLAAAGLIDIEVFKDLPGLDRVVRAFRPNERG